AQGLQAGRAAFPAAPALGHALDDFQGVKVITVHAAEGDAQYLLELGPLGHVERRHPPRHPLAFRITNSKSSRPRIVYDQRFGRCGPPPPSALTYTPGGFPLTWGVSNTAATSALRS